MTGSLHYYYPAVDIDDLRFGLVGEGFFSMRGSLCQRFGNTVLLKVGDEISTDTILPAGASNLPKINQFVH